MTPSAISSMIVNVDTRTLVTTILRKSATITRFPKLPRRIVNSYVSYPSRCASRSRGIVSCFATAAQERRTSSFGNPRQRPPFLEWLVDQHQADVIAATHTGIRWQRSLSNGRRFINVGALGRPENDGQAVVWYALFAISATRSVEVEFVPVAYPHERLAREMRAEKLPEEFVETVLTGWWTTCLEILPSKERRRGKY